MAKTRAFKIFVETKDKFDRAIGQAEKYIAEVDEETTRLSSEAAELQRTKGQLQYEITTMKKSVVEIDRILGV